MSQDMPASFLPLFSSAKNGICSLVGSWGFYQGEASGGSCHGEGVARFNSGDITRGQFSEHRVHGLAVTVCPNGSCIAGMHRNGKLHGPGVVTDSHGRHVYGNWEDGVYSGPNPDALRVAVQAENIAAGISLRLSNRNSFIGSGIGKIFQALGCISLVASVHARRVFLLQRACLPARRRHAPQVLLSGHFILFFSVFLLLLLFSILPVLFFCLQPPTQTPPPKIDVATPEAPPSSEPKAPDAADTAPPSRPDPAPAEPTGRPGLMSLLMCVLAALAVLFSKHP
jgi:hypothetical protein